MRLFPIGSSVAWGVGTGPFIKSAIRTALLVRLAAPIGHSSSLALIGLIRYFIDAHVRAGARALAD